MGRERTEVHPALGGPALAFGRPRGLALGVGGRLDLLDLLQAELELVDWQAIGPRTEAVTLQLLDDLAKPLALGTFREEQALEKSGVVSQRSMCAHEAK